MVVYQPIEIGTIELEELLAGLVENKLKVVLVPHIHQDIEAIGTALEMKFLPNLWEIIRS